MRNLPKLCALVILSLPAKVELALFDCDSYTQKHYFSGT